MIQKELKLGLVISSLLLVVLVSYALVMTRGNKRTTDAQANGTHDPAQPIDVAGNARSNDPSLAPQTGPTATTETNGSSDNASTPRNTEDPFEVAANGNPVGATPTQSAASPDNSNPTNSNDRRWDLLLSTGRQPAVTQPPTSMTPPSDSDNSLTSLSSGSTLGSPQVMTAQSVPATGNGSTFPTPPLAADVKKHTVRSGETITKIAQAEYGSQAFWPYILKANPGVIPEKLKVGTILNLPMVTELPPINTPSGPHADAQLGSSSASAASKAAAGGGVLSRQETAIDPKTEYRVASGDSLHEIAVKLYGKTELWQKIYDLNAKAIGPDPAKLKLDMILKLPEPPQAQSASAGR